MTTETNTSIITTPAMGMPFEGGYYGGAICLRGQRLGVIWAPKAQGETEGIILPEPALVEGAISYHDSAANTLALHQAGSPLAQWAMGLNINGHTDWLLPARDVLELGYRHLKPTTEETWDSYRHGENHHSDPAGLHYTLNAVQQTTATEFQAGGAEAFEDESYWSSSIHGPRSAWYQTFSLGCQDSSHQLHSLRARAVRLIHLAD